MKCTTLKKYVKGFLAAFGLAAMAATSQTAQAGHIWDFIPCDALGNDADGWYGDFKPEHSIDNPYQAGESVYFKMRLVSEVDSRRFRPRYLTADFPLTASGRNSLEINH